MRSQGKCPHPTVPTSLQGEEGKSEASLCARRGKVMRGYGKKVRSPSQEQRSLQIPTLYLDLGLPVSTTEKINVCLLSHAVCVFCSGSLSGLRYLSSSGLSQVQNIPVWGTPILPWSMRKKLLLCPLSS